MNKIGLTIKSIRIAKGWNIQDLAKESGIAYNTIKSIEQENRSGNFDTIEKILNSLGYEIILMKN